MAIANEAIQNTRYIAFHQFNNFAKSENLFTHRLPYQRHSAAGTMTAAPTHWRANYCNVTST